MPVYRTSCRAGASAHARAAAGAALPAESATLPRLSAHKIRVISQSMAKAWHVEPKLLQMTNKPDGSRRRCGLIQVDNAYSGEERYDDMPNRGAPTLIPLLVSKSVDIRSHSARVSWAALATPMRSPSPTAARSRMCSLLATGSSALAGSQVRDSTAARAAPRQLPQHGVAGVPKAQHHARQSQEPYTARISRCVAGASGATPGKFAASTTISPSQHALSS